MDNKILIGVLVVAAVVLGGTALYKSNQSVEVDLTRDEALNTEVQKAKKTITTKYQYKDGQHIFVGNLKLPTPCHTYNAEVVQKDGAAEIRVTTEEGGVCVQQITERLFKVSFEGEQGDNIFATLNGETVNLNIFEIPEDEDIDDIEIFIKG